MVIKAESAERHHAMVNFWRTTLACMLGTLFWFVDRLDVWQRRDGDDCRCDRTGDASA